MVYALLIIVTLVALFIGFQIIQSYKKKNGEPQLPYQSAGPLLTPAERNFFGTLVHTVGQDRIVMSKVRIADLVVPKSGLPKDQRQRALNRINSKHVDFVICAASDLTVLAAVELDDASHSRSDRKARDTFVDDVFAAANIPLLRIPAKTSYAPVEIRNLIATLALPSSSPVVKPVMPHVTYEDQHKSLADQHSATCPSCGDALVKRTYRQGAKQGTAFLGCRSFPKCRFTRDLAAETVPA